jgi:hypothetical protein
MDPQRLRKALLQGRGSSPPESMMMNIRKLRDRTLPAEYLLDLLSGGLSTLATVVQKKHNFLIGNFLIAAPDSVDVDQLSEFGNEIRGVDHSAAIRLLAGVVKRFISNRNGTVLLQDFVNHVSDPHWEEYKFKDRATTYNSEVY